MLLYFLLIFLLLYDAKTLLGKFNFILRDSPLAAGSTVTLSLKFPLPAVVTAAAQIRYCCRWLRCVIR